MNKRNMQKISEYGKEWLEKHSYSLLNETVGTLSLFLLENIESRDYDEITEILSSEEVDHIVEVFLKNISPELLYYYQNIRGFDSSIKYKFLNGEKQHADYYIKQIKALNKEGKISDEEASKLIRFQQNLLKNQTVSGVNSSGRVNLSLDDTLNDAFVIAHEIIHKIFLQNNSENEKWPVSHDFLVEVNALVLEMLLRDYLEVGVYAEDAKKYMYNRVIDIMHYSYQFEFEMLVLKIIQDHGTIDDALLEDYIEKCDKGLRNHFIFGKEHYLELILQNKFQISLLSRYIFGFASASLIKKQICQNERDISSLFKVGKSIYEPNLDKALRNSGLDFFRVLDDGQIKINMDKLNQIFSSLKEEIDKAQNKSRK